MTRSSLAGTASNHQALDLSRTSPSDTPPRSSRLSETLEALQSDLLDEGLGTRDFGALGEQYACVWLQDRGWHLLVCNWHSRYGEIDLVMLDDARQIVIVEVKSRRSNRFGTPEEAITPHKRIALRRAAMQWLRAQSALPHHRGIRFDVVAILVQQGCVHLRHMPGAF